MKREHESSHTAASSAGEAWARDDAERIARAVDPDEMLERLSSQLRVATTRARKHRVELYSRASVRTRVSIESPGEAPDVHLGFEDGIAARAVRLHDGAHGFAASAGTDRVALEWVVEQALRASVPSNGAEWADGAGHPLLDREPAPLIPSAKDLSGWLELALGTAASAGVTVRSAWVEAALTTETIAAHGGLLASRHRSRVWALGVAERRPRILGARALDELDSCYWARSVRVPQERSHRVILPLERPALFYPEAAASLVTALVRAVQSAGDEQVPEIGPGWRVSDDPTEPRGLVGGSFDDAGFPASRRLLWDDARVVGRTDGVGHYRRASYRDPPSPMATTLVVEPKPGEIEDRAIHVEAVRVHPVDSAVWILEMSGRESGGGAGFRDAMLEVKPLELLRRCRAAVGEPRWFPQGIVTPAVFFESLRT